VGVILDDKICDASKEKRSRKPSGEGSLASINKTSADFILLKSIEEQKIRELIKQKLALKNEKKLLLNSGEKLINVIKDNNILQINKKKGLGNNLGLKNTIHFLC
jgi:hypothetical protein